MKILGIETSCDETATAIIEAKPEENKVRLLSNVISSSLLLHAKTGGIIPEVAAREQVKYIIPVIERVIENCKLSRRSGIPQLAGKIEDIDAIAVTVGPGLIGSLLVGIETAKTLAYVWKKPIIPVNHLVGHIYANFVSENPKSEIRNPKLDAKRYALDAIIEFPAIALIVSGGHTDLLLMKSHGKLKWLGGTRDDAAGEAFDKIGRLLGISYPAGPQIEKLAKNGNEKAFNFPRPMIYSKDFDFSFSGLKTAVWREINKNFSEGVTRVGDPRRVPAGSLPTEDIGRGKRAAGPQAADFCASAQQAIVDVLIAKTIKAAQKYKVKSILLSGGVAANQKLRNEFKLNAKRYVLNAKIFVPPKNLCTDNAAMIASAAFFNYNPVPWRRITANPELYFDY